MVKRLLLVLLIALSSAFFWAEVAAPPPGTVLFSDDFNDGNADGWVVDQGTWSVINNTYCQTDTNPGLGFDGRMYSHVDGSNFSDFNAEVEAVVHSAPGRERDVSVPFRATDLQNYYHFRWYSGSSLGDDHLELYKVVNGTPILLNLTYTTLLPVGSTLTIKLSVRGDQLWARVWQKGGGASSSKQVSATDSTYTSGFFGLDNYKVSVCYDNIVVTS